MLTELRLELGVLCIFQTLILICMVIIHMSRISVREITGHMAKSSSKYKSFRDDIDIEGGVAGCTEDILNRDLEIFLSVL